MTRTGQRTLLVVLLAVGIGGCEPLLGRNEPPAFILLTPTGAGAAGLDAIGGLAAWQTVASVRYRTVLVAHEADGASFINRHAQKLDLTSWKMTAVAQQPDGTWAATVDEKGQCVFDASHPQVLRDELRNRLSWALPLAKYSIAGALNLLATDVTRPPAAAARIDGKDLTRLEVTSTTTKAVAYYLGAVDKRLLLITTGADAPSQDGTVTLYEYTRHDNGLTFPSKVTVLKIGDHALIGTQKILELDLQDVVFEMRPPEEK